MCNHPVKIIHTGRIFIMNRGQIYPLRQAMSIAHFNFFLHDFNLSWCLPLWVRQDEALCVKKLTGRVAFKMPKTFPTSREGRNLHGKHNMTKGAFGRIFSHLQKSEKRENVANFGDNTVLLLSFIGRKCRRHLI